jgi:hypothetical protein
MVVFPANISWLVVWNMFLFFHVLGIIIPTDKLIFFGGVETTNQSLVGAKQLLYFQPWKWNDDPDVRRFFSATWQKQKSTSWLLCYGSTSLRQLFQLLLVTSLFRVV